MAGPLPIVGGAPALRSPDLGGDAAKGVGSTDTLAADAELIATASEHVANLRAYNTDGGILELADDPLWRAYRRTLDALNAAQPQTLAGVAALIGAIQAEDCEEFQNSPGLRWAWTAMEAVQRLAGRTGA